MVSLEYSQSVFEACYDRGNVPFFGPRYSHWWGSSTNVTEELPNTVGILTVCV